MALPGQSTARAEPDPRRLWRNKGPVKKLDNDELLALINEKAGSGDDGIDPTHLVLQKQWFINIVHFVGLQSFDSYNLFEDIDPNFLFADDTYVANHLFRIMMSGASRLTQARPDWDVIPRSPDEEDQDAAKVGQHLLEYFYDSHEMKKKRMDLAFWLQACGTGFVYANWDETLGEVSEVYRDPFSEGRNVLGAAQLDEPMRKWLKQVGSMEENREGDLATEVVAPFQVLLPHAYTELDQMPWAIISWRRSIDWVWDHFPKDVAEKITVDDIATNKDGQYWHRLSTLINRHGFTIPSRGADNMDQVEIRELWIPPSKRVPNGVHGMVCNNQVLKNDVHPFHKMGLKIKYPLIDFHYCPVPGRFWSMGVLEHLIGPQRDYNRARQQIIAHRDVLAVPQWLSPEQAELTNTRNDIGDLWEYRAGFGKPELQNPPAMSQTHVDTIERAVQDMQQISAQSDVTQAQVPQGVRSGVAIRALQEKDYQVLSIPVENMEMGFKKLGSVALQLYWKNMKSPRAIEIYGENRMADISFFQGSDIRGNTAVRIANGSMMPKSKAETQELLLDLMQMQAIDMADKKWSRMVFRALEVGGTDQFFLEEQLDERRARIENKMFHRPKMGQPWPAVSDYDDHQIHIEEHLKFMKTDSYERLPPMRKVVFQAHLQMHEETLTAMQDALAAAQPQPAAGPAGPPGPGGGSPPADKGQPSPPAKKNPTPGTEGRAGAA